MKKTAQVFGFLGGTIILFILFDAALMLWQLTPIAAISKYQHVKSLRWHRQHLVEHFPERIPSSAQGAKFYKSKKEGNNLLGRGLVGRPKYPVLSDRSYN